MTSFKLLPTKSKLYETKNVFAYFFAGFSGPTTMLVMEKALKSS